MKPFDEISLRWNSNLPNWFQRFAQIISVVGVFISLFFAYKAVQLTKKYGEDKAAVDTLTNIAKLQVAIIDTLRNQNTLSREEVAYLEEQNQSIRLSQKLQNTSDKTSLESALVQIYALENLYAPSGNLKGMGTKKEIEFLTSLKNIVPIQLTNRYLALDDTLLKKWVIFNNAVTNTLSILSVDYKRLNPLDDSSIDSPESADLFEGAFIEIFNSFCKENRIRLKMR